MCADNEEVYKRPQLQSKGSHSELGITLHYQMGDGTLWTLLPH